jgi:hypothetical protein
MSLLAIYLQDHHAAAVAGTRLARRVASNVSREDVSGDLSEVADEIADDLAALETIMRRLGTSANGVKDAIARGGERLGRLKLNGRLRERSPLSDVVELETLVVGITGKQALWVSLRSAALLPTEELDQLIQRAERQKRTVESAREAAARRAFDLHGRSGEGGSATVAPQP